MSNHLLNYQEAADYLDLRPSTVKKLCDQHKIGYVVKTRLRGYGRYIRRQRFIPRGELLLYMAEKAFWKYVPRLEGRYPEI
jgi:hypothetical protein